MFEPLLESCRRRKIPLAARGVRRLQVSPRSIRSSQTSVDTLTCPDLRRARYLRINVPSELCPVLTLALPCSSAALSTAH
jgi:hypothetical protein